MATSMWGLDHAANGGIDFPGAKSMGFRFTMRYLAPHGDPITTAERDHIFQAGLGLGLIWELQADRAMGGADVGRNDAALANSAADVLDAPPWLRLTYAAGDLVPGFTPTDANARGPIAEYCRAFRDASSRPVMPYGPYNVIEIICGELQISPFGWQSSGGSGFGNGSGGSFQCFADSAGVTRRLSRFTAMFQDFGSRVVNTDQNAVLSTSPSTTVDWAWGGDFVSPTLTPTRIEDLMSRAIGSDLTGEGQFIITPTTAGLVRIHIPNPDALSVLKKVDAIAEGDPIWLHGAEASWFASLPAAAG
jgi:hypothetical protein